MQKIKKGDNVKVLIGKDAGKTGSIERIMKDQKVLIPGINIYKRHVKKQGELNGGILDIAKPINISNIALICKSCNKITRVGFKITDNGKLRVCKKCGKEINEPSVTK